MKKIFYTFFTLAFSFIVLFVKPVEAGGGGGHLELMGGYVKALSGETSSPAGFSFEAWIYPSDVSGKKVILSIGDKSRQESHYEVSIRGGSLTLDYYYDRGSRKIIAAGSLYLKGQAHIAVTVSSGETVLYINGSKVYTTSGALPLLPIGDTIVLGSSYLEPLGDNERFKGTIQDVRISRVARNITALWNTPSYYANLMTDSDTVLLWHLNETRGTTTAYDASGNNIDGTLIGGDAKIHFWGELPTPTPWSYTLPPIRWTRPVLPTLSLPGRLIPTQPPQENPDDPVIPTPIYTRPVFTHPSRPMTSRL